jgi:hypothetical protein
VTCGDRTLSLLVVALCALMGWQVLARRDRAAPAPPVDERLDMSIDAVAEAIARAEGYYARGGHDGRSLLFRLNNPGGLKKPALNAEALPTWEDTGLVCFPTKEMGWAALRHQVRLMLTGRSRIYNPSERRREVRGRRYQLGFERCGSSGCLARREPRGSPGTFQQKGQLVRQPCDHHHAGQPTGGPLWQSQGRATNAFCNRYARVPLTGQSRSRGRNRAARWR